MIFGHAKPKSNFAVDVTTLLANLACRSAARSLAAIVKAAGATAAHPVWPALPRAFYRQKPALFLLAECNLMRFEP